MPLITIFIVLIFLHSLFSARLERTVFTAPILFTAAGMITLFLLPELRDRKRNIEIFLRVAEAGLTLLLFTDASRTDLKVLKHIRNLPVRLLSVGMPLTLLLGALRRWPFSPALRLGGRHSGRHPRSDRCRTGTNHREQPAGADENPPCA